MMWGWLARNMAPLTLLSALAAYVHPPLFLVFRDIFLWCFAAAMLALGIVLHPEDAKTAMGRPGRIGLGVVTQYAVMPLLGFAAASVLAWRGAPSQLALGFIIVGCAPGAMASNVMTYLAGGAVAFSIAVTTLATLISPLATPALVQWLGGVFFDIPFWPMMVTILWTVVAPLLFGMWLRPRLGRLTARAEHVAPAIAALAIIVICSYAVAANEARIAEMGFLVFVLVVAVNGLGYVAGWGLARLYGFDRQHRLTLAIEIGMQNAGLGVALALKHFSPEAALPGALFAVWCILTAAAATRILQRYQPATVPG